MKTETLLELAPSPQEIIDGKGPEETHIPQPNDPMLAWCGVDLEPDGDFKVTPGMVLCEVCAMLEANYRREST